MKTSCHSSLWSGDGLPPGFVGRHLSSLCINWKGLGKEAKGGQGRVLWTGLTPLERGPEGHGKLRVWFLVVVVVGIAEEREGCVDFE